MILAFFVFLTLILEVATTFRLEKVVNVPMFDNNI